MVSVRDSRRALRPELTAHIDGEVTRCRSPRYIVGGAGEFTKQ